MIKKIYLSNKEIYEDFLNDGNLSKANIVEDNARKIILLSATSFFEQSICDLVISFVAKKTNSDNKITNFIKNKAVSRQYHTFFDWDSNNVNKFLSLFGEEFKKEINHKIELNSLSSNVEAFIELGRDRNSIVHNNFATVVLEKNSKEVYEKFEKAIIFIEFLKNSFNLNGD